MLCLETPTSAPEMSCRSECTSCSSLGINSGHSNSMSPTWTPQVCKIMAFMAVIMGLGLLFYILAGLR